MSDPASLERSVLHGGMPYQPWQGKRQKWAESKTGGVLALLRSRVFEATVLQSESLSSRREESLHLLWTDPSDVILGNFFLLVASLDDSCQAAEISA